MKYFVICLDDDGTHRFASHGYYYERAEAERYAQTVSQARTPLVVSAPRKFYPAFPLPKTPPRKEIPKWKSS